MEGCIPISDSAKAMFESCWYKFQCTLVTPIKIPREVVWLNGAPGSGKGANCSFILTTIGASRVIPISQLLDSSKAIRDIIDRGELVPDELVLDKLLEHLLHPSYAGIGHSAVVVDGFPRTPFQVDLCKILYDKLVETHLKNEGHARPRFKAVILHVDEKTSIKRQLERGNAALEASQRASETGVAPKEVVRATDMSAAKAHLRYQIFKEHASTLKRLQDYFPYHVIDSMGTFSEVQNAIKRELRYQSSLELSEGVYNTVTKLPLARDLFSDSRQQLVARLDQNVLEAQRHLPSSGGADTRGGHAQAAALRFCRRDGVANPERAVHNNPIAADIFSDIMADRGFGVTHEVVKTPIPASVNKQGEVLCKWLSTQVFYISFSRSTLREHEDLIQDFMHTQDQARDPAREEVYRRAQAMNVIDSMEPRGIPELQKCIATVSQIIADSSNKQRPSRPPPIQLAKHQQHHQPQNAVRKPTYGKLNFAYQTNSSQISQHHSTEEQHLSAYPFDWDEMFGYAEDIHKKVDAQEIHQQFKPRGSAR
eukprot:CAMPEP_0114289110 /NCGR_PEP_ID=MMETSP0059-20121206/7185_1 /TAXON_ID=36894 /ORGANISM="Pyramimonas parkeae, Strain CCMP726" /LENGTH=537 /DNA_ID=CAMNT_0001410333 /DNA_START=303 /DNA_END=1917 /DNA_ORIENTATION=+